MEIGVLKFRTNYFPIFDKICSCSKRYIRHLTGTVLMH